MAAQRGCAIMQAQAVIRAAAAWYKSHRAGAAWALTTAGGARAAGVKHSRQTALAKWQLSSAWVRQYATAGCYPRRCSTVQIATRWSSVGTANRGQRRAAGVTQTRQTMLATAPLRACAPARSRGLQPALLQVGGRCQLRACSTGVKESTPTALATMQLRRRAVTPLSAGKTAQRSTGVLSPLAISH